MYEYNGREFGDEEEWMDEENEENEQLLFMFMCTTTIVSSLCLVQIGNVMWGVKPSDEKIVFSSPVYANSMTQALLLVVVAVVLFYGVRTLKVPGPARGRFEYAVKQMEKADTVPARNFFAQQVAHTEKKLSEEEEIESKWPVILSSILLFAFVVLWVSRQSLPDTPYQPVPQENTNVTKKDHHLIFWSKYTLLASLLYVVVSEMVRNINEIMDTDTDFCSLKRFAAERTIELGEDVVFQEADSLKELYFYPIGQEWVYEQKFKTASDYHCNIVAVYDIPHARRHIQTKYMHVNPVYTLFVVLYTIAVGWGAAFITDDERRKAVLGYNPYIYK